MIDVLSYRSDLARLGELYLYVKVTPKTPKTELVEIRNENIDGEDREVWKIRLRAVPEDGKANRELEEFVAELFEVPRKNTSVMLGKTSREKVVKVVAA